MRKRDVKREKSRSRSIFGVLLIVAGVLIAGYPYIRMRLSALSQAAAVAEYESWLRHSDREEMEREHKKAEQYNRNLSRTNVEDPFGNVLSSASEEYWNILDLGDGMMGTLEIPRIGVSLPIYHGVEDGTLRKGAGHLPETAIPVGGAGNHAVLCAHRGLPEAKLFTDLDQMENGDPFYIRILDETLAYEVDQIKVVEPSMTDDLLPVAGEDHVTLLTCTPYGINSHRLLIRGVRTEYAEETVSNPKSAHLWPVAAVLLLVAVLLWTLALRRRKGRSLDA